MSVYELHEGWDPLSLLGIVASDMVNGGFGNALIDTGALITGMENRQVQAVGEVTTTFTDFFL